MNSFRIGHGYDVHRLVEGRKLILGGVDIPHSLGLLGHSDADALIHALMDAILGALALGDIGRHFPDNDEKYEGISSMLLLSEVKKHPAELIGFITLHPDLTEAELDLEVRLALENGLQGVKLHPDFQRFDIDGEDAEKIYKAVGDKLPILFHTGDDRYDYSSPERLVRVAKTHPEVRFIAAHFGAYRVWEKAEIYRGIPNIWFDTSSSLAYISPERARELIDILGIDRFFFATDFPMWRASEELERFYKIPLSDTEREMILGGNIRKFLGI